MTNDFALSTLNPSSLQVRETMAHVVENQAEAIWTAARTPRVRLFVKTLWFTGLRISEVLKLRARDLNGQEFILRVMRAKKRTQKFEDLPLPRQFGQDLRDYIRDLKLEPSNKLFPGHENTYRYQIRECAKRVGMANWAEIHPHMFRHGFVYDKARKGVHPYTVSKLCGHSSLGITLQYYQPTQADLRDAMEK